MMSVERPRRALGTMVAYGFARGRIEDDLVLAARMKATVVEILPDWRSFPDPRQAGKIVRDRGLEVHSAHACWGGQSVKAARVDLASTSLPTRSESVDDVKRCLDWLSSAGGRVLVVHPGGLSDREEFETRQACLLESLAALADHAADEAMIAVENMPSGVYPGSRTRDLHDLVCRLDRRCVRLALDTGHAEIVSSAASETLQGGEAVISTHVHDNNGKSDSHGIPGSGRIDWTAWIEALDSIQYRGPIMLECIRDIRRNPEVLTEEYMEFLGSLSWNRATIDERRETKE